MVVIEQVLGTERCNVADGRVSWSLYGQSCNGHEVYALPTYPLPGQHHGDLVRKRRGIARGRSPSQPEDYKSDL
jgi:hypothetical protein